MTAVSIFRCPLTHGDLSLVGAESAENLRRQLSAGELLHLGASRASANFESFFKASGVEIYYPVRDEIIILLPDFAIMDRVQREFHGRYVTNDSTMKVMKFYDELGWTEAGDGIFVDADINEDFRSVSKSYVHLCHMRVNNHLPQGGQYILDIASGPVQYDEYLTYSENFELRICCDVSFEALRLAKSRVGERGLYIQCDITNMPFKDDALDAFVSLHTIYHVPAGQQIEAFQELMRVTKPGAGGVVVYSWDEHSWLMRMLEAPGKWFKESIRRGRSVVKKLIPKPVLALLRKNSNIADTTDVAPIQQSASTYSFYAHTYDWFNRNVASYPGWAVYPWRSVSVQFVQARVPDNAFGRWVLASLYRLENAIPGLMGRIGQYPSLVYRKPSRAG